MFQIVIAVVVAVLTVPMSIGAWYAFKVQKGQQEAKKEQQEAKRVNAMVLNALAGDKRAEDIKKAPSILDLVTETMRQVEPMNGHTLAELIEATNENTEELALIIAWFGHHVADNHGPPLPKLPRIPKRLGGG